MGIIGRHGAVLGLDVGKSSHWACLVTSGGEIAISEAVPNREAALAGLYSRVGRDTLVVVDQVRNIGALALRKAADAGLECAYLPGSSAHEAAKLFSGDAKTDERDAMVIAKTALGIPDSLRPISAPSEPVEAARALASQRDYLVTCATRSRNRLHAVLLELCPAFEALVDLDSPYHLRLLESVGGPWAILDAGKASVSARTRGADRARIDAMWDATCASDRPGRLVSTAQDGTVRELAGRIRRDVARAREIDAEVGELLSGVASYRCLLTIPGIGPRTASELVTSIDISMFESHDRLASYCGLAPRNRQSGTSLSTVSSSRQGNRKLKSLLIFSCNSLITGDTRYGRYYRSCRERGMGHTEALKATARKRLKVVYAIMRDEVPYRA